MQLWKIGVMIVWCLFSVLYVYFVFSLWNNIRKNEQILKEREEEKENV